MEKPSWEQLEELAAKGDAAALEAYLAALPPGEAAWALTQLAESQRSEVLTTLAPTDARRPSRFTVPKPASVKLRL